MPFPSLLPRGTGTTRRGFDQMIKDIAAYYPKAFEEAYVAEIEIMLKFLVDHTPIDSGAAAGVTSNSVGHQKHTMRPSHKAYGGNIGNMPGDTGWQIEVNQQKNLKIAIVNPQWSSYLKFLELGIVEPIAPAKSHFVFETWKQHEARREKIRDKVRRGRS